MTKWGKALELLRERKGWSKGEIARQRLMEKNQYYTLCRSKRGPSMEVLERLIVGMGYTWYDLAQAIEEIEAPTKSKAVKKLPPSRAL